MGERNQNPGALLRGMDNGARTGGKHTGTSSKRHTQSPHGPAIQFLGRYSKELKTGAQKNKTQQNPYNIFTAALLTYPKGGNSSVHGQCINTMWSTHTTDYHSATKGS